MTRQNALLGKSRLLNSSPRDRCVRHRIASARGRFPAIEVSSPQLVGVFMVRKGCIRSPLRSVKSAFLILIAAGLRSIPLLLGFLASSYAQSISEDVTVAPGSQVQAIGLPLEKVV